MKEGRGDIEIKLAPAYHHLIFTMINRENKTSVSLSPWGPFHNSSYERFLLYEFVEPVLKYGSNEFVALTNLCETGPWIRDWTSNILGLRRPLELHSRCSKKRGP